MAAGDSELTGPDLAQGIAATTLAAGSVLLGHAGGEPVLLARVGDDYLAVGAKCTHYGGPLADGVIAGDTIRCPWHHACFSLRTGEALRAPALNPVATWNVERRGSVVAVTHKAERDPLAATMPVTDRSGHPRAVVIIGAGAAGAAAAEMLRRCGYEGDLTMIDSEADSPYDRPNLSKDYLAGNAPEEWIPIRPPGFYEAHRIRIIRSNATHIDVAQRCVEISDRPATPYDALLVATGAEPVKLTLPGSELPHVFYLRSLADSRAIIAASLRAKTAVVIGTSFIGLEVAASLRARNIDVHVVAPEAIPLERILGAELGLFVKSLHEEKGVRFHLGRKPKSLDRASVTLDEGTTLSADMVVIGVGVKPRLALAEQAGLTLDRGVTVNEYLETSVPGVFAAGDIARWYDPNSGERIRVEHWAHAQRMGQAAARNMLGARERFTDVPFFWSAHYDVSINYVGHAERWDQIRVDGSAAERNVVVRYVQSEKTVAVASVCRDDDSLRAEIAIEQSNAAASAH